MSISVYQRSSKCYTLLVPCVCFSWQEYFCVSMKLYSITRNAMLTSSCITLACASAVWNVHILFFTDMSGRNFLSSFGHFWAELFSQVGAARANSAPLCVRAQNGSFSWQLEGGLGLPSAEETQSWFCLQEPKTNLPFISKLTEKATFNQTHVTWLLTNCTLPCIQRIEKIIAPKLHY